MTLVSVPQAAAAQPVPDNDQVTPLFCVSFCTCAVNGAVNATCTEVEGGVIPTEIGAGVAVIVIVAEPDLELSATRAFSVTVADLARSLAQCTSPKVVTFVSVPRGRRACGSRQRPAHALILGIVLDLRREILGMAGNNLSGSGVHGHADLWRRWRGLVGEPRAACEQKQDESN